MRRIEVFEKLEKHSRAAGNLIVIHYTFQLSEENRMSILEKALPKQAKTAKKSRPHKGLDFFVFVQLDRYRPKTIFEKIFILFFLGYPRQKAVATPVLRVDG